MQIDVHPCRQIFVSRLETQLIGADTLEIRHTVDGAYEQIVQVMFESLQQMAKMSDGQEPGGTEDKGVLNFHVILIGARLEKYVSNCVDVVFHYSENMHHFIAEVAQQELGAMQGFLRRAQGIYEDNLGAYVKLVLRRPMHKITVRRTILPAMWRHQLTESFPEFDTI